MTNVLLAIDEAEDRVNRQLETLEDLALADGASVTALYVFSDNPSGASVNQLKTARRAEERLEAAGYDVTLDERSGEPGEEILTHAAENDVDLICLAGRKRSPTGKALFGSVTQDVILGTDRPVLIAGNDPEE
ncbi:universal stress protein [Natrarchaeobaculum aegyptiacum]|uniref:Universal stress protein UspA n=1 Tax=Natrarchaeobaculum aegyptiacum TaxID=745377 RepID=A0A2Z2HX81_9EURY|nr:universal stress protein [Natrarchaeobaculum aegyptiacum]ARS89564.1 universal stress protein UspA [Natrarchaeobaculum aegyptiacum]